MSNGLAYRRQEELLVVSALISEEKDRDEVLPCQFLYNRVQAKRLYVRMNGFDLPWLNCFSNSVHSFSA